jgi:hypothetical protein
MPGGNNSLWWSNRQGWRPTAQGGPEGGGGGEFTAPVNQYRDPLDAARSGAFGSGRVGEATYPDGYLQPSDSRRRDAPASVYGRLTDRSYQRGINAGVKMDQAHYFWPIEQDPNRRLAEEAGARYDGNVFLVRRAVPYGDPAARLMHGPSLDQLAEDVQATPQKTAAMSDWMPTALW